MARFHALTRLSLRGELRRKGFGPLKINGLIDAASDDVIDAAVDDASVSATVGAFGDGTVIQTIIDWLKSDAGQAFIAALLKIILALV
jgi:hypothetical protein